MRLLRGTGRSKHQLEEKANVIEKPQENTKEGPLCYISIKIVTQPEVVIHASISALGRQVRWISEFEATLIYRELQDTQDYTLV